MYADDNDQAMAKDLDSLPLPEAPADLKAAVMAKLAGRRPRRRPKMFKVLMIASWAAAAASLLAIVVNRTGPAPSQSAATMAPQAAASWPQVHRAEAPGAVLTVRRMGDDYAFLVQGTGRGTPALRWDSSQWEAVATGGNPTVLRRLSAEAGVSLWVGGAEVLKVPVP